ncbi:MAG: hypothetical protein HY300_07100, partial [Verrucomicrobia bacterium]|nr:hypothetical protein [Verrucomicrobiota bacterium]
MNEKTPPWDKNPESNVKGPLLVVTVCVLKPVLVHVTVSPTLTVLLDVLKKLSPMAIVTVA